MALRISNKINRNTSVKFSKTNLFGSNFVYNANTTPKTSPSTTTTVKKTGGCSSCSKRR